MQWFKASSSLQRMQRFKGGLRLRFQRPQGRWRFSFLDFWFCSSKPKSSGSGFSVSRLGFLAFWLEAKKPKSSASWRGAAGTGFLASMPKHQKTKKPKRPRHRCSGRLFGFSSFWLFGVRLFCFLAWGPGAQTPKSRGGSPQSQQPGFLALELSGFRKLIQTTHGLAVPYTCSGSLTPI